MPDFSQKNQTRLICELCETVNVACSHHRTVSLIDSKLTGEKIDAFDRGVERIQTFIEHRLRPIIAHQALSLAMLHYGKSGIVAHWREGRRRDNEEWTAEELAEFDEWEREEREKRQRDYTPPTDWSGADVLNIARFLLFVSEQHTESGEVIGDADSFDAEFERIMLLRYKKTLVKTRDGERWCYERVASMDDSDAIITTE